MDLVITGCSLPDQSCLQLAREMKRLQPTVPIVILNTGCEKLPRSIDEADVIFRSGVTPAYLLATIAKLTAKPLPPVEGFTEPTIRGESQSGIAKVVQQVRELLSTSPRELAAVRVCPSAHTIRSFEKRK
jgi:hypothetical protein